MKFFQTAVVLLACSLPGLSQAQSSRDMTNLADQPGYVPTATEEQLDPALQKQIVFFRTAEHQGRSSSTRRNVTFILSEGNSKALRYSIGVGQDGFQWAGLYRITRKAEWPDWTPPPEMIERQPYLPRFMAGGPGNPMGACALYIGDTVYRLHGTNQPQTIGSAVSSGCFRLVNEDIVDLFGPVPVGTKIIVKHAPAI